MTPGSPRLLFRAFARAEMVTWALLLSAMVLKYSGATEALMPLAGGVHGLVFLCYAAVAVAVWIDGRWSAARGLAAVGAAVVPFLTVPMERRLARRGLPADRWRLATRPEEAQGPFERLLRAVLRRPLISAVAALAVVGVVFVLLLQAGPPTQWF